MYAVILCLWVFLFSKQFGRRIKTGTDDECEKSIIETLNQKYSNSDGEIEQHQRFGKSIFHINSILSLRGYILIVGLMEIICFLTATIFIMKTFGKLHLKKPTARRTGMVYGLFSMLGICLAITMMCLFFAPIHSCVFIWHKAPIIILTLLFIGPYKMVEIAVTIQYIRIKRIARHDRALNNIIKETADEPGWLITWWRNRNLPEDSVRKLEQQKADDKEMKEKKILKQLSIDNLAYREANIQRIRRNELAERILWMERIGKMNSELPDPNKMGDDTSGIFSFESTATWATNLSRSSSRSSPDSADSVENYMDNYEDYYDQMIKLHGASPSVSSIANKASDFTFKTLDLNPTQKNRKIKPKTKEKQRNRSISASDSLSSITTITKNQTSRNSVTSTKSRRNTGDSVKGNKQKKKKPRLNSNASGLSQSSYSFSVTNVTKSQSGTSITQAKGEIESAKKKIRASSSASVKSMTRNPNSQHSVTDDITKTKELMRKKSDGKTRLSVVNEVSTIKGKNAKRNSERKSNKATKNVEVKLSESELDEESQRPKIVKGKEPKVMKKKKSVEIRD